MQDAQAECLDGANKLTSVTACTRSTVLRLKKMYIGKDRLWHISGELVSHSSLGANACLSSADKRYAAHTHTLSHTHTLTHTHTHTHTLSHTHSYTHTLTHTNTYIHTHAHPSVEWQSPGSARATHNRRTGHPDSIISLTPPPTKDVQRWGLASKLVEVRAACCKDFGYCQAVCLGMARIMYIYINGVYSVFWREKHQSVLFYKGWQTML